MKNNVSLKSQYLSRFDTQFLKSELTYINKSSDCAHLSTLYSKFNFNIGITMKNDISLK